MIFGGHFQLGLFYLEISSPDKLQKEFTQTYLFFGSALLVLWAREGENVALFGPWAPSPSQGGLCAPCGGCTTSHMLLCLGASHDTALYQCIIVC